MKKKLLIVLPSDQLGGAEKILLLTAIEFHRKSYDVDVFFLKRSLSGSWDRYKNSLNLYFTNYSRERFAMLTLWFKIYNNHSCYSYVVSSNTTVNGYLGFLRKVGLLNTKKLILRESTLLLDRYHGIKGNIYRLFYKVGYSSSNLIICQTDLMKDRLLYNLRQASKWNLKVIPNPIDVQEINEQLTDEIDLTKYGCYIVAVGRLIELKGFDLLINALAEIKPNYNLVILGDGIMMETLRKQAINSGVSDRLFLVGHKNNPYQYMKHAKLCVISSRIEGFPNTLLQMMAVNNNVISTRCAGGIDKIEGLITCETNNLDSLIKAIEKGVSLSKNDLINNRKKYDAELDKRTTSNFVDNIIKNSMAEV